MQQLQRQTELSAPLVQLPRTRRRSTGRRPRQMRALVVLLLVVCLPAVLGAVAAGATDGAGMAQQQPRGRLVLAQVVFRHGARTPLSTQFFSDTTWARCSEEPLQHTSSSSGGGGSHVRLRLFDPAGAPHPPELSGGNATLLPGGCRMGALTDGGFAAAGALGAELRRRYVHEARLLPPAARELPSAAHLTAHSTAVRRTVCTLRGVLDGLLFQHDGSSSSSDDHHQQEQQEQQPAAAAGDGQGSAEAAPQVVVHVAVPQPAVDTMAVNKSGCASLHALTAALREHQAERDAHDGWLHAFERRVRSELQLPDATSSDTTIGSTTGSSSEPTPLHWTRLWDEYVCAAAEGQPPAAAAAHSELMRQVDRLAVTRRVELSSPEHGDCLLGRRQRCEAATALTIGRLLHSLTANMTAAAAKAHGQRHAAPPPAGASSVDVSSTDSASTAPAYGHLQLFSAHDTTLMPLLAALGQHQAAWPDFTSWISFELWQDDGADGDDDGSGSAARRHSVRVLHNGQPLRLPLREDHDDEQQQSRRQLEQSSGGEDATAAGAFVVSLQDFRERVLGAYVLSPEQFAEACGAAETQRWQQQ